MQTSSKGFVCKKTSPKRLNIIGPERNEFGSYFPCGMGHFLVVTVKLSGAKMLLYPTVKRHPWFQCKSQPPRNASKVLPLFHKNFSGIYPVCSLPQQRDRDEFVGIVMLAPSAQQASTVLAGGIWGGGTGGANVQTLDDFLGGGNS